MVVWINPKSYKYAFGVIQNIFEELLQIFQKI